MPATTHDPGAARVGEIAATLPGASGVFRRFGIEFCCQGHVALADAARLRNIDLDEVTRALDALDPDASPAAPQDTAGLIDHIQTRYHDAHRQQLPELITLSRKVEETHVTHPDVPAGLAAVQESFLADLDALMREQETVHFVALRDKAPDRLALSIRNMRHDHNQYAYFLDQLAQLTDDLTLPGDACPSWQALYGDLARFKADLIEHIHLENNVLFPRFDPAQQG